MVDLKKLFSSLEDLNPCGIWIATSGGMDSMALLHLTVTAQFKTLPIEAIYFDHGLSNESMQWGEFVKKSSHALGIRSRIFKITLPSKFNLGLEGEARKARYAVLKKHLPAGYVLLTAHHLNDQSETFFLNVKRGAGLIGASGIPMLSKFGQGWLHRPLLQTSKEAIESYQKKVGFEFIHDPSNDMLSIDRNFIRKCVLPTINARFSKWNEHLADTMHHCQNAAQIIQELSHSLMNDLLLSSEGALKCKALNRFSLGTQLEILKQWLRLENCFRYSSQELLNLQKQCFSGPDAKVFVQLGDWVIRRYQERLFFLPKGPIESTAPFILPEKEHAILELPPPFGSISWSKTLQAHQQYQCAVYAIDVPDEQLLTFSVRPLDHPELLSKLKTNKQLKNFFQQHHIPPWLRPHLPQPVQCSFEQEKSRRIWLVWRWWDKTAGKS